MGLFFLAPYGVGNGMDATNPVLYTNSPQCSTAPPMVEIIGLEPMTSRMSSERSNQLSYTSKVLLIINENYLHVKKNKQTYK